MKMRKVISALLSLTMVAGTFAGTVSAEEKTYATTGEAFELYYIAGQNENAVIEQITREIVAMYQEQVNPNFTANIEYIPDQQTRNQKVRTLAASNELPDLWRGDIDSFFYELQDAGMIANVGELFKEIGIYDNFYWCALDYPSSKDGEVVGMSLNGQGEYFWYNKDVFAAAGIEKDPETFDELLEACAKIQETGVTPIGMEGQWRLLRYLGFIPWRLTGNDYIDKLATGEAKYSDELGIQAAQFVADIGQYFQPGWTTADGATVVEQVKAGQLGMFYTGTWELPSFTDENGDLLENIGIFKLPLVGEGDVNGYTDSYSNGGTPLLMNAEVAQEEEMKNFLAFFWDHYNDMALERGFLPPGKPSNMDNATELQKQLIADFENVTAYAKCWDVVVDVATSEVLLSETPGLTLGDITPEEWAARMDEAAAMNIE